MSYEDNVLIKLRRDYSKDEAVSALFKKIDELSLELGKMTSEIAHLEHELTKKEDNKEVMKLAKVEARKEKLYQLKLNENAKLRKENQRLQKYKSEILNELLLLKEKLK